MLVLDKSDLVLGTAIDSWQQKPVHEEKFVAKPLSDEQKLVVNNRNVNWLLLNKRTIESILRMKTMPSIHYISVQSFADDIQDMKRTGMKLHYEDVVMTDQNLMIITEKLTDWTLAIGSNINIAHASQSSSPNKSLMRPYDRSIAVSFNNSDHNNP